MIKSKGGKVTRRGFVKGAVAGLIVGAAATYGATQIAMPRRPVAVTEPVEGKTIYITVNGETYDVWVSSRWTLHQLIREELGLTGTGEGCSFGECGLCTMIANGKTILACQTLAIEADGWNVTTIEGLGSGEKLNPLQQSFAKHTAFQCGSCTPGFILSGKALLDKNPNPTVDEVREAISGNFCRCGTYDRVEKAILDAEARL
jgi:aerobic-type carbon monoxide dehydrogenase small subunit (CoxS/CutS family)